MQPRESEDIIASEAIIPATLNQNDESVTENRNGIVNPLDEDNNNNTQSIDFSSIMTNNLSATPMTTAGIATFSQDTSIPIGWNRRSYHRRNRGRRLCSIQGQWKNLKSQHGQWTCFFCCHVRTGTIIIGFWHMILHLMALSLIAAVMINPDMMHQVNQDRFAGEELEVQDVQAVNCSEMPCLLATQGDGRLQHPTAPDFPLSLGSLLSTHRLNTDVNVTLFITLCTFIVTLLMVFGAFREQPSHLMPFFFLQVFDFCISSVTMFGHLSELPNVRRVIAESPVFPLRHLQSQLKSMDTRCLTFFVMLVFVSMFLIKAYCMSIVWRCYKFLMQPTVTAFRRRARARLGGVMGSNPVDQESQTLVLGHDLPDYDTAIADPQYRKKASGLYPEPPPTYDVAMAALIAQQHILDDVRANAASSSNAATSADDAPLLNPSGAQVTEAQVNNEAEQDAPTASTSDPEAGQIENENRSQATETV